MQSFTRSADPGSDGVIKINPRQVYILPTRFGLLFAIMVLAMLFGANNYGSNPGFLLTFLLAGLGMACLFQTWKNLAGIEITASSAEPVFCRGQARFNFTLHNPFASPRPGIWVNMYRQKTCLPQGVDLAPGINQSIVISRTADKRGIMPVGRIVLETRYPLGLFRAWAYASADSNCLVYPKPGPKAGGFDQLSGEQESQQKITGGIDDFAGHKPYQQGDNVMHVDWKAVARGKGWQIKNFDSHVGTKVWLNWDLLEDMEIEAKLSCLARAIIELDVSEIEYGLQLPDSKIDPANGASHRYQCLRALALF